MITKLENVTISFPNLFHKGKKSDKFDSAFIFDENSPAHTVLAAAIDKAGKDRWADKWGATKKALQASGKLVIHSGDTKADKYQGYEGRLYINAKNDVRPDVRNRDTTPLAEEDGVIYPGCVVHAYLDISAFENDYGKFVGVKLLGVQFVKDGERFGGTAPGIDFTPISEGVDAEDL